MASRPMSGAGKAGEINKAAMQVKTLGPRRQVRTRPGAGGIGNETRGDVQAVQEGGSAAEAGLSGAVAELHRQHPHHYTDHGPHHGTSDHVRHEAVSPNAYRRR